MAYNDKIVIQQATESRDDYGEVDTTWATYKTVWAERQDQTGNRGHNAEMPIFTDGITFKIHRHDAPDLTTKMRVSYDSQVWVIRGMRRDGRLHTVIDIEAFDDE